jgi:hypothetical protein
MKRTKGYLSGDIRIYFRTAIPDWSRNGKTHRLISPPPGYQGVLFKLLKGLVHS